MEKILTFVCCPKPFTSEFTMIQRQAIQSWKLLPITRNIVIVGKEKGCKEFAEEIGAIYEPDVQINEWKTPLVNSIFALGHKHTPAGDYTCYINSDIILLSDFADTVWSFRQQNPKQTDLLLVGQRWNWKTPKEIDFTKEGWAKRLKETARGNGKQHPTSGIDYFVHTKATYPKIHPFAIGRFFWDWWLVGNCYRRANVKTVDITRTAFAIHQDSPWYQKGSVTVDRQAMYRTPEVRRNHSFDRYGRNIETGTRYISKYDKNGKIIFQKK